MNETTDKLLAQNPTSLGTIGEGPGFGPLGFDRVIGETGGLTALMSVISLIIGFITIVAGIYFLLQLLIGGFEWMSASGDKSRLQKSQDRMSHAIMGLIIVVAAYALTSVIGTILGLDILITNPQSIIDSLGLGGGTP